MTWKTRILTMLVLANLAAGCTTAVVGGAATDCDRAVDHLADCGVSSLSDPGECTAARQQLATQILATPCSDVPLRQTFSGSTCDSIWSRFFNPSCWGEPSEPSSSQTCEPLGKFCHVDDDCCSRNCDWDSSTCEPSKPSSSSSSQTCRLLGKLCYVDDDCCSRNCDWDSGRCEPKVGLFGMCDDDDECDAGLTCEHWQCLRGLYTSCGGSNECATNICRWSAQGSYCVCPLYDYKKPKNAQCIGYP